MHIHASKVTGQRHLKLRTVPDCPPTLDWTGLVIREALREIRSRSHFSPYMGVFLCYALTINHIL